MKQIILLSAIFYTYTAAAQPHWQQKVDTKIDVQLDDKHHFLLGYEEFTYYNNSPDTLHYIYLHLWPNAYKNDHTPFARQLDENRNTSFYYSKPKDKGYIDSLQFTVDGRTSDPYISDNTPDICRLDLQKPLYPGEKIKVTTPFRVKIPKVFSRMGHTRQAYYITQWFPKPAVYDQKGWHPISYLDQGEFFSEYGSYDVRITLPANYVVMATGNCLDEKENAWLDELSRKPLSTDKYKTKSIHQDTIPPSAAETKTLHFHEDNVHDFAWFADKRYLVQKDTVYSPGNNLLVTTWAAFLPSYREQWKNATGYLKETIKHYGRWVGPYQYKTIKAVIGDLHAGGGMEYPTVTIIDKAASFSLKTVVIHEAGHNWFYGMLGSNERDHAWMDEGINTFYEQKTSKDLDTATLKKKKKGIDESVGYYEMAATGDDQAIEQTSENFEKLNYGLDIYFKTALGLKWLEQYMGPEHFEKGMKDYYDAWHFHHPYPEDFRTCMQRHSIKSLNWFFDTLLTTDKKIDFTITRARTAGGTTEVTIRNNKGVTVPALVDAYNKDSIIVSAWTEPFTHTTTLSLPTTSWNTLKIDAIVPDGKPMNDVYRRKALFHHFGVQVRPFFGLNSEEKDRVFVSPALGYNQYDGLMAGILLHNITIPENRFRFALVPMYAFQSQSFAGAGSVAYVWYPGGLFKEIMLQTDAKTFHNNETTVLVPEPLYGGYTKIAPSLKFTINEHNLRSPIANTFLLKGYSITEQNINFDTAFTINPSLPTLKTETKIYGLLRFDHQNFRTYNPFMYRLEGHGGADFAKLTAEGMITINYNMRGKALNVRAFAGKFFPISDDPAIYSRYALNAAFTGPSDYLYDGTYIARSATEKIGSQQLSIQEGGFKIPTFMVDRSDNWMAAINLRTDLPIKRLPIRLFFDAGLIPNPAPSFKHPGSSSFLYDGGIEVYLIPSVVSVYIPVIMSSDFQNYLTTIYGRNNVFAHSISFTFHMQNINWLNTPSRLLKMTGN